jgi:hypothetical protein
LLPANPRTCCGTLRETDAEKIARPGRENKRLRQEVERLRRQTEEAPLAVKRQVALFPRRFPQARPRAPGRRTGRGYGPTAHPTVPAEVDQTWEAELPSRCPDCGGAVVEAGAAEQYQTEIPKPRVERIRFRVRLGRCRGCGRRVQGRRPRQSSNAVATAARQLGPRAVALATQLNKGPGAALWKDGRCSGAGLRGGGKPRRYKARRVLRTKTPSALGPGLLATKPGPLPVAARSG